MNEDPSTILAEAYKFIRLGCFEKALDRAALFVDQLKDVGDVSSDQRRNDRRFSTLKQGLILIARLHRIFGSYVTGSMLLAQALANANDNHDINALRMCILEESAYDINALNNRMLSAFSRHNPDPKHVDVLQKTFMARFNNPNNQNEIASLDETYSNLLSAGFGKRNARFKAVVQHFRIGIAFMRAVSAAIRCERPDMIEKYKKVCLENEISTQWHSHSRYIRDGIDAIESTMQLANGCTAILPTSSNDDNAGQDNECTLISAVNVAYSYAYKGNFSEALDLIDKLKERFPIDANPMIAVHWRLAESCILFDQYFFKGEFEEAEQQLEYLECFSPIEALFRKSLLDFVYDRYDESHLTNFIKTLRKNIDPHLKIRCRMALGTLKCTIGKHEEAVDELEKCVKSAQKHSLNYMEKAALRRLAYAYICCDNLIKADECLKAARSILTDTNGYTLETLLFHATQFEFLKLQLQQPSSQVNKASEKLRNEAFYEINCAAECLPVDAYPILERRLFREATLFANNALNDKSMANSFAERYLSVKCENNINFSWFVL